MLYGMSWEVNLVMTGEKFVLDYRNPIDKHIFHTFVDQTSYVVQLRMEHGSVSTYLFKASINIEIFLKRTNKIQYKNIKH